MIFNKGFIVILRTILLELTLLNLPTLLSKSINFLSTLLKNLLICLMNKNSQKQYNWKI
uniref:Uncharacterized protein n=1 Tax=Gloeochaete wittrockiana TaxID=38269 RepID=A0A3G1IVT9_9EUKA|nr:hypothetical protein [Gloeochaete wittrockiana]YP_009546099.1 hypothetical protein [Gloeochaete wittrockiana]ASQ40137.1 hypothetical protein [Gloeochaete wittrockiana]ASQ40160.1 hypothetical protein [Gloeochaete wittrockiana]